MMFVYSKCFCLFVCLFVCLFSELNSHVGNQKRHDYGFGQCCKMQFSIFLWTHMKHFLHTLYD